MVESKQGGGDLSALASAALAVASVALAWASLALAQAHLVTGDGVVS